MFSPGCGARGQPPPQLLVSLAATPLALRTLLTSLDSGAEQHHRMQVPEAEGRKAGFVCPDRLSPNLGAAMLLK